MAGPGRPSQCLSGSWTTCRPGLGCVAQSRPAYHRNTCLPLSLHHTACVHEGNIDQSGKQPPRPTAGGGQIGSHSAATQSRDGRNAEGFQKVGRETARLATWGLIGCRQPQALSQRSGSVNEREMKGVLSRAGWLCRHWPSLRTRLSDPHPMPWPGRTEAGGRHVSETGASETKITTGPGLLWAGWGDCETPLWAPFPTRPLPSSPWCVSELSLVSAAISGTEKLLGRASVRRCVVGKLPRRVCLSLGVAVTGETDVADEVWEASRRNCLAMKDIV